MVQTGPHLSFAAASAVARHFFPASLLVWIWVQFHWFSKKRRMGWREKGRSPRRTLTCVADFTRFLEAGVWAR